MLLVWLRPRARAFGGIGPRRTRNGASRRSSLDPQPSALRSGRISPFYAVVALLAIATLAPTVCSAQTTPSNPRILTLAEATDVLNRFVLDDCIVPSPEQITALQQSATAFQGASDFVHEAQARQRLGTLYDNTAQYTAAVSQLRRALAAGVARDIPTDIQLKALLGDALDQLSQRPEALRILNSAINEAAPDRYPLLRADALRVRAETKYSLGDNSASSDLTDALKLTAPDRGPKIRAEILNDQGVIDADPSHPEQSFQRFHDALALAVQAHDCRDQGEILSNQASLEEDQGEAARALEEYDEALPLLRQAGERDAEARALHALAKLHEDLGNLPESLRLFEQALAIEQQTGDVDAATQTRIALGTVDHDLHNPREAQRVYGTVLRTTNDPEARMFVLNNLGTVEADLGHPAAARRDYRESIAIAASVKGASTPAYSAWGLGELEEPDALSNYFRALRMAEVFGLPDLNGLVNASLMDHFRSHHMPDVAIFFGKQAVDQFQGLRANMSGLGDALVSSFLQQKARTYRVLARLLIDQGRLGEAQQVLDLLKIQQYTDYMGAQADVPSMSLVRADNETRLDQEYHRRATDLITLNQQLAQHRAHDAVSVRLGAQLASAQRDFDGFLTTIPRSLGTAEHAGAGDETADQKTLDGILARNPHTAIVYTLTSDDGYNAIVLTSAGRAARSSPVGQAALEEKCHRFLDQLSRHRGDPRPTAQDLYDILVRPLQPDLEQAQINTVIWYLDGALRFIPMSALMDRRTGHYLIQDVSVANYTPFGHYQADLPELTNATGIAMGASESYDPALGKLEHVPEELDQVVTDPSVPGSHGVLPGNILLNERFTRDAMETQTPSRTVIHIASHFVLRPGNDTFSFLMLGGERSPGEDHRFSLADFKQDHELRIEGVELVTLSACETGAENVRDDGVVMEGLSEAVLDKHAKAVISSLWQVNDASTASIMASFYRLWIGSGGRISKSEALRRAQLDLIEGKSQAQPDAENRGVHIEDRTATPFSDPYYWAPFVLTGNWQ